MAIRHHRRFDPLWIVAGLLGLLLPALAAMQYVWLTRLSDWQERRMLQLLQAGADRLAEEFADALEPYQGSFHLFLDPRSPEGLERQLAAAWRQAGEKSPLPARALVRRVLWVAPGLDGALTVQEFLPEESRLRPGPWPAEIAALGDSLARGSGVPPPDPGRISLRLTRDVPIMLFPHRPAPGSGDPTRTAWIVLVLDRDLLARRFLPDLVSRYLAGEEARDLQVAVLCGTDPPSILYASEADLAPAAWLRPDVDVELLRLRSRRLLIVGIPSAGGRTLPPPTVAAEPAPQEWRLLLRHRAGSVAAYVRAVRLRNMLAGGGMLAALAGSILLLLVAARRARRLARLQMEFISGVSHELRTPLAVITAAGENLADAVVGDPEHTREYGRMIHREGRRLGRMVDRVLQFARLRAEPGGRALRPLPAGELIAEALATYRLEIEERRIKTRTDVPADCPPILGEREGVVAALENLISNAVKYGGAEGEVTLHARPASLSGRPAVALVVSDRGPGIPEAERAQIFEPFVRGRLAREGRIKGSGLGLSLVCDVALAHGGRVRLDAAPGGGARFTLTLPASVEEEPASEELSKP